MILIFGILPILEIWSPVSTDNCADEAEKTRSNLLFFNVLLYLNAPILFGIIIGFLLVSATADLQLYEWLGLMLGTGLVIGTSGINVAHELGHRTNRLEQMISKWLLLPALYQHFFIEHNRGHHKYVATTKDPATSRKGEVLYFFWVRSIFQSWISAWNLEKARLIKAKMQIWSLKNEMIRFVIFQFAYLFLVYWYFGTSGVVSAASSALVGILLLETVNYLEHYGLVRRLLPNGFYEPVSPAHSWNSNHELGRIFLYELTRHSDHHYKSSRKYQVLRHLDNSPQLPFGYPTSVLIALVPPLWFRLMNPRLPAA